MFGSAGDEDDVDDNGVMITMATMRAMMVMMPSGVVGKHVWDPKNPARVLGGPPGASKDPRGPQMDPKCLAGFLKIPQVPCRIFENPASALQDF